MTAARARARHRHPDGRLRGARRGSFLSQVMMTVSLLGVSLPTFLIGILLILVFAVPRLAAELRPRRHRRASAGLDHRLPHTDGLKHLCCRRSRWRSSSSR
jgi:ABC-type dipeptide/oligopeptide/nickel transport system permease component